jgi:hypothetical protein
MSRLRPSRRTSTRPDAGPGTSADRNLRQRGQVLVIFAFASFLLIGMMALVVDVSWYWANTLKVQRAADAAALAGVVLLPGNVSGAQTYALNEAKKNGYSSGTGGVTVAAAQEAANPRRLDVTVSAPVPTFFMRAFGITSIPASRAATAEYVLPVAMGSPLNVYGKPDQVDLNGNPLNFWGSINAPETDKNQGDPFATTNGPGGYGNNAEYVAAQTGAPGAYNYGITVPAGSAPITVSLYDPEFCYRPNQNGTTGMNYDTGDTEWSSSGLSGSTTKFTLYEDVNNTPYNYADDTQLSQSSYPSGNSGSTACGATYISSSYPNFTGKWVTYTTIASPHATTYRLNVATTGSGQFSNQFGIKAVASSGSQPTVSGLGAMSLYANIPGSITNLYLAQIPAIHAGKTVQIRLFDPGEASSSASLSVLIPTSSSTWTPVSFTYWDAGVNGDLAPTASGPTTSLTTTSAGGTVYYNGHWVILQAVIPSNYTAPANGWWKIQYNYGASTAHDRTTWQVNIVGNPVHLVLN